jgi:stage III sporulation protein AG
MERLKSLVLKEKKWLAVLLVIGILLMVLPGLWVRQRGASSLGTGELLVTTSDRASNGSGDGTEGRESISRMEETLALDAQRILSKIRGVGVVYVAVTLESGVEREFAETARDTQVARESAPILKGVLVVAEGAGNKRIQGELSRAVQSLFGVASHQVMVVEGERAALSDERE